MKNNWQTKKLGEIAKISYGYTEKASFEKTGPKFLRITDIQNDNVNWNTVPYCKITENDFDKYQLNEGDIVFARTGATTGKSFLVNDPPLAVFASYLIKVKVLDTKQLTPEFLFLFFQTNAYWSIVNSGLSGSAQGGFNASKLSEISIPVSPIKEQKRIVAILDQAFADIEKIRANTEKNLKNARDLFESYLQQVFSQRGEGWETKKLGDFITLEYGKPLDRSLRKNNGKYPAYGANGVKAWSDEFYYDTRTIIVGRKGSAGEITLTEEKFWPLDVTYFVKFDEEKYNLYFIYYLLSSLNLPGLATGVKPGINRNNVYSIEVNVPNVREQKRIVAILRQVFNQTDNISKCYKAKLLELDNLKKSLLHQAFTGQLTKNEVAA